MNQPFRQLDEVTRRRFMAYAAKSVLGVSVLPVAGALAADSPLKKDATAKQVIYLFMSGAMSHLDTFDPKPGSEVQGPTKAIDTKIPGVQVSEHLPNVAKQMNKFTLVRSLSTETGAHQPGRYLMRTSYKEIASIRHPGLGPWIQKLDGKKNPTLPASVMIGNATQHPGAGFLEALYAPVPIGDAATGLQNTQPPKYLEDSMFNRRMSLASQFDSAFQTKYRHREVESYSQLYREAVKLLNSTDLKAFDIGEEPEKLRTAYGDNKLGQGALLARRLVESGVRFVEVDFGNWDDHREVFENLPERALQLDQALTALLDDLESKGMLDETLVVVATEFGRTPNINQNTGRDHHPGAFTCVLAGGGTKGGKVWGASDENAFSVEDSPVTVQDFNATIAYALGLPLDQEIHSKSGRPFVVANHGTPLIGLF